METATREIDLNSMLDNSRTPVSAPTVPASEVASAPAPTTPVEQVLVSPPVEAASAAPVTAATTTVTAVPVVAANMVNLFEIMSTTTLPNAKYVKLSFDNIPLGKYLLIRTLDADDGEVYLYDDITSCWMDKNHAENIQSIRVLKSGIVVNCGTARYYFGNANIRVNVDTNGRISTIETISRNADVSKVNIKPKEITRLQNLTLDLAKLTMTATSAKMTKDFEGKVTDLEMARTRCFEFMAKTHDINYLIKIEIEVLAGCGF